MTSYYVNPSGKLKETEDPFAHAPCYDTPEAAFAAALDACREEDKALRQRRVALNRKLAGLRLALTGKR